MRKDYYIAGIILVFLALYSCANMGNPSGGPKDLDPPVLLKSKPVINEKNYTEPKVQLFFDEIVVLKEASKYFIVSPPMEEEPEINALAKKITIDLNNELQPNTTYTIYLGSSIVDNNEGNPLEDFTFSFSTGEVIDSMAMSGKVLRARDLEPQSGVIVGIYSNLNDSAFIKNVPLRIARTNSKGEFIIKNITPGTYKIYALKEPVKNYRFDPGEEIAFLDTSFTTYFDTVQVYDTIWQDSITIDTIIVSDSIIYGPEDILLQSFEEYRLVQNLRKKERTVPYQFLFSFSSPLLEEPKLTILDTEEKHNGFYSEMSVTRDTIFYWITDSNLYKNDSLLVSLAYQKTDSLEQLFWQTDTINMIYRKPRVTNKKKKEAKPIIKENLKFDHNAYGNLNLKGKIVFKFREPIEKFRKDQILLYLKSDTLKQPLTFDIEQNLLYPRTFILLYNWEGGETYTISIDSASIRNIYGMVSDKFEQSFKIRSIDEYGNILFNLNHPGYYGELFMINNGGEIISKKAFEPKDKSVEFNLVLPGKYYFYLYFDLNENGKWDTGEFSLHQQPEPTRYFPKAIDVKAYRDYEEDWNTEGLPLWKQKPEDLIGKEDKKSR